MAYIGASPSNGVRRKHTYTATASQTTFSGAGAEGAVLSYRDSNYVDVYRNGVKLGDADYTATSGTSIVLGEGAAVSDIIEIVTYDVFSVADTVSKADGGTFDGNIAMAGTLAVTGETTLSANLNLGDNDKAIFGAGDDLQIYHNGTDSKIYDGGTGNLTLESNGTQIELKSTTGDMVRAVKDDEVVLFYSGSRKLATTNTGIDVTGVITTDGMTTSADINFGDNDKAVFGAGSDLQIYHDGSHSIIKDAGTGNLQINAGNFNVNNVANTANIIVGNDGGEVNLYYNGSKKLATTSTGIDVTGTAVTDGLTVAGNVSVDGGTIKLDGNYPVGAGNVALGEGALTNTTSNNNTAVGQFALTDNVSGTLNCSFGILTLGDNTSGSSNTAYGMNALRLNTTGSFNTAVGHLSGYSNTTASNNTSVGYQAGYANTTGNQLVAVGFGALDANTTGAQNVAVGKDSLGANTTANNNTAIGDRSLLNNTTGGFNAALGGQSLYSNTTANNNTAVGYQAGYSNTTGTRNTALGHGSLYTNITGNYNVALGDFALRAINANNNVAVGSYTMYQTSSGTNNTAVGSPALTANTTGSNNTAVGRDALAANTTASNNVAVGYQAGYSNTTGNENTTVGQIAGYGITTGIQNTAIGRNALSSITTAVSNTAVGQGAGREITSGANNTIIGRFTGNAGGLDIRTSSNNIVLSDGGGNPWAYRKGTTGNWYFDQPNNNEYSIRARTTTASASPYGIGIQYPNTAPDDNDGRFLICSDSANSRLFIYNDGDVVNHDNSYGAISDVKLKEQITDASSQWEDIKALTVRKYKMKSDVATGDSDAHWRLGVIAQEVEEAGMSGLIKNSPDKDANNNDLGTTTKEVKYSILYMKAVKALQEAMTRIETLEAKVTALENG